MINKERVTVAVFRAICEANKQLSKHEQLEQSLETVLIGPMGRLDSLGSVIFFSAVEDEINKEFNASVTLIDEKAISQNFPLQTIEKLIDYICLLLKEKTDGYPNESTVRGF